MAATNVTMRMDEELKAQLEALNRQLEEAKLTCENAIRLLKAGKKE